MNGIELIAKERDRQIDVEVRSSAHDDEHTNQELARAAVCYTIQGIAAQWNYVAGPQREGTLANKLFLDPVYGWGWSLDWWKPSDDPIRNLVKAGALIAAEIDRLQRAVQMIDSRGATAQEGR